MDVVLADMVEAEARYAHKGKGREQLTPVGGYIHAADSVNSSLLYNIPNHNSYGQVVF